MLYDGENLSGLGTVIAAVSRALVAGDVLRIEADDTDPTIYRVKVNGVAIITRTLTEDQISIANSCVGFVVVAEVTEELISPSEEDEAVVVVKDSDEARINDTALADDSALVFPIGANELWAAHFNIVVVAGGTAPDLKHTISAPAGATGTWSDINWNYEILDLNTETFLSTGLTIQSMHIVASIINGATPGSVAFKWAQNVLNASESVTIKKGSQVIAFKQA